MNHNANGRDPLLAGEPGAEPAMDAAVARALGRKPSIVVPETFAARVTQNVFAQAPARRSPWLGWGPRIALGSAALLTAGMFALAPHAAPSLRDIPFDGELLLLTELGALLLFSGRLLSGD